MAGEGIGRTYTPDIKTTLIQKRFVKDMTLQLIFGKLASPPDKQGLHKGDGVRWLRFDEWPEDVTALSETTTTDNKIQISGYAAVGVNGTVTKYGGYVQIEDFSLKIAPPGTLNKVGQRAGDAGARGIDRLLYNSAITTTNFHIASMTAVNASGIGVSGLQAADFSKCANWLHASGVPTFAKLGGTFAGVVHPLAAVDLETQAGGSTNVPTFATINQYVPKEQEKIMMGELGRLYDVSIFKSPIVAKGTWGNQLTWDNVVFGDDGLGCASLEGPAAPKVIVKTPGPHTVSQPTDTYDTVAWVWYGGTVLMDARRVIKLMSNRSSAY